VGGRWGLGLGVVLPDVVVGVPEAGRRLERMPVVVRWRGSEEGGSPSRGTLDSSSSSVSSSLDSLIVIALEAMVNKLGHTS
jgi:hypothetical protein